MVEKDCVEWRHPSVESVTQRNQKCNQNPRRICETLRDIELKLVLFANISLS